LKSSEDILKYSSEALTGDVDLSVKYESLKRFVTRTIDIVGSIVGIIILAPVILLVIVINYVNKDFAPIFFVQKRIGKDGKEFKMIKFRTMIVGAEDILEKYLQENKDIRDEYLTTKKLKNDPRVTKAGKLLRKTSLDEFPQFLNILKGNMTLVGPRPYLPREKEDMGEYYEYISTLKPGITGPWQVSGRSNISFDERLKIDMEYYYNKTIKEDMKIVLKTVAKTIKCDGAV